MAKTDKKAPGITPLGDRVLIRPLEIKEKEKRSAAGIILLSDTTEDKVDRGTVVAVGSGRINSKGDLVPLNVKEGDKVLFQWGDRVTLIGEEYFIVSESSVLAIIR